MLSMVAGPPVCAPPPDGERMNSGGAALASTIPWRTSRRFIPTIPTRGFRLGGINDPINLPLCTPKDRITFGGRDSWTDETVWDYEVGA